LWALAGGVIVRGIPSTLTQSEGSVDREALPKRFRDWARECWLCRPDGSKLRVECYGREDAPPIILTHILPPVPGGSAGQSKGYRSCADYLHQPGLHDEDGKFLYRAAASGYRSASASRDLVVAAGLAVELDELPERFRVLSTKSSGFAGTETWEALNFVTRFQLQASPAVLAQGMFGMLRYDATAALKAIKVPALVVAGNRDPVCTLEASERMQRDIPGAQMVRLAPAKHMVLIEHHAQFAKVANQFSASCLQPNLPHSAF
jgi:alpha/beta hydrolase fold